MDLKKFSDFVETGGAPADLSEARQTKKIADMSADEHARHIQTKAEGANWVADHPVSHHNIIEHYNQASPDEKKSGHDWYQDAHEHAKIVAKGTKTPMHAMAGLLANYSPQTHWHTNILTAAKVARTKTPMGGKGSGVFADEHQKAKAGRMLSGEHYDHVLTGQKVKAFAHLIEHGDNANPSDKRVVVDRHAYSVAAGGRATDSAYAEAGLQGKKRYGEVSNAYKKAAEHISAATGSHVEPHHVQATTWLVRQRLNEAHDRSMSATASSGVNKHAQKAKANWDSYAAEHHPHLVGQSPGGTGYSYASGQ